MKFKLLIKNKTSLSSLMNAINDKNECKITNTKTIIKLARIMGKVNEIYDLFDKMERGIRKEHRHLIKNLPENMDEKMVVIQKYNDIVAESHEGLLNEEVPAEMEVKLPIIKFEKIEELHFTPAILGGLINLGMIEFKDDD